jgi:hypothetical protein
MREICGSKTINIWSISVGIVNNFSCFVCEVCVISNQCVDEMLKRFFLLSIYDSNESIVFVHEKLIFFIEVLDEL